jgi:threonine/homoserine/homoserine lactone efflux protein
MDRLKDTVTNRNFWLALGGIVLLAFLVNLVELICSAGFPAVYLQILSLTPMPFWQYYLYLLLYIVIFMLDDIIVLAVAMLTLQLMAVTTRYKRLSNLIGGVLMLLIGILLIFKPGWLMFG